MGAITSSKALQDIEKGKFAPIYWIWGPEAFFTDKLLAALKKKVVTAAPDFNFDNLDAGPPVKSGMSQVIGAASSHPTMAPLRLVLVKSADAFKADDYDALADYAANPLGTTVLCFVSSGDKKPDLRRKAFKAIDKLGGLVECKPVYEREIPAWVDRMAKERGMSVERGAVDVLVQYIGTDLLAIDLDRYHRLLPDRPHAHLPRPSVLDPSHPQVLAVEDLGQRRHQCPSRHPGDLEPVELPVIDRRLRAHPHTGPEVLAIGDDAQGQVDPSRRAAVPADLDLHIAPAGDPLQ